jgi:hypothetical protein
MHIVEQYSLSCGLKIDKPYIFEKFFPLPFEKYVVLDTSSEFESQNYQYWNEVLENIYPILNKDEIKIVRLSNEKEIFLKNCFNLPSNSLTLNQKAFIIKNSLMFIGTNNFNIQLASFYKKKIVSLYSNLLPSHIGPFWSKKEDISLITPELKNSKPYYLTPDSEKLINTIKPELITKAILDSFNYKNLKENKTLFIGDRYSTLILEAYPEQVLQPNVFPNYLLNIRLDWVEEINNNIYNSLINNLNVRPCSIITDKAFNLQPLLQFKEKLNTILYDVTKKIDIDFINQAIFFGIKMILIFRLNKNNEEDLSDRKFKIIDMPNSIEIIENKIEFDLSSLKDNTFFKSTRLIFKNNKIYNSESSLNKDLPIKNLDEPWENSFLDIKDQNSFFEKDLEYSYIFEKN